MAKFEAVTKTNIILDECGGKQCTGCRHCRKLNSARAEGPRSVLQAALGHGAPSCPSVQRSLTRPIAEEWPLLHVRIPLRATAPATPNSPQPSALQPLKVACRVTLALRVFTRKLSPLRHSGLFTTPPSNHLRCSQSCDLPAFTPQNEQAAHHGYTICIFDARV